MGFNGTSKSHVSLGNAGAVQHLFTIENGVRSNVNVYIKRLTVQLDAVAVMTLLTPAVRTSRATGISGGMELLKGAFDNTYTSDPYVVCRAPLFEMMPITATSGDTIWQKFPARMHTAVEQQQAADVNVLPSLVDSANYDFILRRGEGLLVSVESAGITSNVPNTNNWFVQAMWEEVALTSFAISGTVTLSAAPIAGAQVYVIEADDIDGTNAYLKETITTNVSGAWASTIRTGKVGSAFVQYETGGIYYTAPGSPFLQE